MSFSFFSTPQQQPFLQPQQRPPPPQQPFFQPQQWQQHQPFFQPQQWQQQQPFFQPQQWQQQQPFFQPQQQPPSQPQPQQPFFQPQQWQQQQPFFQPQQPPPPQQPYFQPQQWQQQQPFFQPQQPPPLQQQPFFQPQQPPLPQLLFIKDGSPATDNTKWEDLHPHSQNFILQIEERVVMYRNESERLDQWSRLYEYSVSNDGFKFDASHIKQVLDGISVAMERPWNLKQELTSSVAIMLRGTQKAVSNFNRLTDVSGERDIGLGLTKRPSSFLWKTVSRFEKHLGECRRWIEELERLLGNSERHTSSNGSFSWQFLHEVMANVHDFFIRVAAKVESGIHQHMDDVRSTYLVKHRRRQEKYDPFRVADQRDTARKEGSSKRLRPTLHSPEVSQPSTELAGLFLSSGTVWASTAPQASPLTSNSLGSGLSVFSMPFLVPSISASPQTSPLTSNSSGSGLSFFSTPYSVPSSSVAPQTSNSSGSGFSFFSMPCSVPSSTAASQTYPLTSNSSGSGLSFFSTPHSVPSSSVAPQTSPLTSNSSGIDLSDFSMPYSVPFSSAVPQTYPLTSKSSGSGLSGFGMPSSVPSSSVPALYMTPTTSAQEFPLSGSSSGTSCPERVLEVVHQASMESSIPSARTQTSLVYSISGTLEAPTATQTSYRRGRFTVCDVIRTPSATSQVSLLNSSSNSLFGSTPSQFGGTDPSRGTTSGGSTSSSPSFSPEIMTPSATSQASLLNSSSSSLFGSTPSQLGGTAPSRSTTSGASTSASPSFSPGPATGTGTASTSPLKRPRSRTNLSEGDSSGQSE